jgi:hypothetical protein
MLIIPEGKKHPLQFYKRKPCDPLFQGYFTNYSSIVTKKGEIDNTLFLGFFIHLCNNLPMDTVNNDFVFIRKTAYFSVLRRMKSISLKKLRINYGERRKDNKN